MHMVGKEAEMIDVHWSHVIDNRCKLLELGVFVFIFYRMITVLGLLAFLPASFSRI